MISKDQELIQQLQTGTTKFVSLTDEGFESLPDGSVAQLKCVSFSSLRTGDYIIIKTGKTISARRFLRQSVVAGITRLIVVDAEGNEEPMPFPRLIGLIATVRREGKTYDPNPSSFLARAAFGLRQRFTGRHAA